MLKHTGRGFALVAVLVAGSLYSLRDFQDPETGIKKGIDLLGGTELVYEIDLDKIRPDSRMTIIDDMKAVIGNRFDAFGLKEISVATSGNDRLIIQLPGSDNTELQRMKQQIERSGELSFHLRSAENYQNATALDEIEQAWRDYELELTAYNNKDRADAPALPDRRVVIPKRSDDPSQVVDSAARVAVEWGEQSSVGGEYLNSASGTMDEYGAPAIAFDIGGMGAAIFGDMTGNNVGQRLCIVLDGTMIQQANIEERINGKGRITGSFTQDEVNDIVTLLRAGSLPAKPRLDSEKTIGALLGRDSIERGTQAMLIGFTVVVIFMLSYYMVGGIVATIALLLNLIFVLAAIQIFRNTLTFPGMAGLLLTVGMAVDANILIFARIREEKERGRGLAQAVQAGYQRAFSTIFDANLTTLITAYILFKFGSGAVKGFAVVLSIGIIASFFTSIYVSRLFLTVLIRAGWVKELRMMSLFNKTSYDFMSKRRAFATLSAILVSFGVVFLAVRGTESLGIDFTGGTRLITSLQKPATETRIKELIAGITDETGAKIFQDVQVQSMGNFEEVGQERLSTTFSIRTRKMTKAEKSSGEDTTEKPTTEKKSGTDLFRSSVEEVLAAEGLLAPEGITDVVVTESPPSFRAKVQFFDPQKALATSQVEAALLSAGFPVKEIRDRASIPENAEIISFVVVAEPKAGESVFGLESLLNTTIQGKLSGQLTLSTPFPEVDSISGRVAQDMQGKVFVSMMIAFFAIIFYISLRFRFYFGVAAIVALVHDILFSLGALAIADALLGSFISLKLNLPVIAALLTIVGYSLNDTIVIFDRIRENLEGKKRDVDYLEIVNRSINQTLGRTILTSATTFTVTLILLLLGGEGLAAFSFALTIGVIVGTYSSIFIACPTLVYLHRRSVVRREELFAVAAAK